MAAQAALPDENDNQGPMLLAIILVFYALALTCFVIRFSARLYSQFKLTAADYTCTIAMVRLELMSYPCPSLEGCITPGLQRGRRCGQPLRS